MSKPVDPLIITVKDPLAHLDKMTPTERDEWIAKNAKRVRASVEKAWRRGLIK